MFLTRKTLAMKLPRNHRNLIAASHDAVMAALSFILSVYIRLGTDQWWQPNDYMKFGVVIFTCICVSVFVSMRLYRGLWRFASMRDMITITRAVTFSILIFAVVMFLFNRLENMPRSLLFINWMLLLCMLAIPRFVYRSLKDRTLFWEMTLDEKAKISVLVVGANSLSEQFIQDMARNPRALYHVSAIIDNDPTQKNRTLERVPIYGGTDLLGTVIRKLERKGKRPQKIMLASPDLSREVIADIMAVADEFALPVARIPRLSDFKQHFDAQVEIQPIAVEDLLGRPQTSLNRDDMRRLIQGKRVLVTGAGGSIGSELVRQIIHYNPAKLTMLEMNELNLYQIDREIAGNISVESLLADVRNALHIKQIFTRTQPEIVFHAAAIKHVPIAEANPEEALLTNVFGTQVIADASIAHHVGSMVMISTDKAVNPTNVMGASKKLAESYCQALGQANPNVTSFITVRFGNVLGSTGSVVPLFEEQLAKGGPLTVTHRDMTRYFMTIREAVELVLQAAAIGTDMHERSEHIFVLDMGKPVKILDLAEQMVRLAGLKPYQDIAIEFTGLRPGEKLYEELFYKSENLVKTPHASILLANPRPVDITQVRRLLETLKAACAERNQPLALTMLQSLVPDYQPQKAA